MRKLDYPAVGETLYQDTLPNGLRLSVAVKPGYSRSVAFFATEYGGADRRFQLNGEFIDTPMGVAHYLEHKMFDMPEGENALSALAASGAQPNAYTASGVTAYHFESTANFSENLRMLLRFVSTPYFTPESVEKEQGIIAQEIRMGDDNPDHVVYEELLRCLYAHHPIRDKIVGTVESIREITPEVLLHCHQIFYNPGNMALAVVGDVDPERVRTIALEVLPAEAGPIPKRDYGPTEAPTPLRTRFTRSMSVSAPQFMLGAKLPPARKGRELLRQKTICELMMNCLYSPSSPFYTRLYAEGLIHSDFFADADYAADTVTLLAGGESRDPEAVFAAFLDEAHRIGEEGIDPAFFSRMKKSTYGSRVRALNHFMGLAAALADGDFGGYNAMDTFAIAAALTREDVENFVREYLRPERFALSVITPSGTGTDA